MRTLKVPFQIDSNGSLAVVATTREIVEQQIVDLLMTNRYERTMRPDYGADMTGFLFSPAFGVGLGVKAAEVRTLLAGAVRLAEIVEVTMVPKPGSPSTVMLNVSYSIRPNTEVFTLTQTLTGLATEEGF